MNNLRRAKRTTAVAALVAASALVMTGCGGGDTADVAADAPAGAPAEAGTEVEAPPATSTAPDQDATADAPANSSAGATSATSPAGSATDAASKAAAKAPATGAKQATKQTGKSTERAGGKPATKAKTQAPAAGAAAEKTAPITSGTITVDLGAGKSVKYDAVKPIRMVWFNFGSGYTYTEAITQGALARAKELGVQLDVKDAQVNPGTQVQQMQSAITSGQYVGGFVLPIAQDLLCDIGTNLAPRHNFMLVVTNAPICGRVPKEGNDTWAPGTLAFDSAGQEISNFTNYCEYIRANNPGKQKVIVLAGLPTAGQSQNANTACRKVSKEHPEFEVVDTIYTDFSQSTAVPQMNAALLRHKDTTIVASIYSELTKGTVQVLKQQNKKDVKVYDVGGDQSVLPMIERGDVQMTTPYYPRTMGATAVQAIYDARVGRKPLIRFYANSGKPIPAMQGDKPLLAITKENLEQYKQAGLSEY